MLFAQSSVKRLAEQDLVETEFDVSFFLLFRSFREEKGADVVSVIRAKLKDAHANTRAAGYEAFLPSGRGDGLAASPP